MYGNYACHFLVMDFYKEQAMVVEVSQPASCSLSVQASRMTGFTMQKVQWSVVKVFSWIVVA